MDPSNVSNAETCTTEQMHALTVSFPLYRVLSHAASVALYAGQPEVLRWKTLYMHILCVCVPDCVDLLAFRSSTEKERRLSRLYDGIRLLHRSPLRGSASSHITFLIRTTERRRAQIMLSVLKRDSTLCECIDVDRVRKIRFMLWRGSCLGSTYALRSDFEVVWRDAVIPMTHVDLSAHQSFDIKKTPTLKTVARRAAQ